MKPLSITSVAVLIAALSLGAPLSSSAKQQSKGKSSFDNTGFDDSATATINSSLKSSKSKVLIKCKGLEADKDYRLIVGGVTRATFTSSSSGKTTLDFQNPPSSASRLLDFDPRGKQVSISDDTNSVLELLFSGEGEPDGSLVSESTDLTPTALAGSGHAEASFYNKTSGSSFKVQIEDVPAGDYQLFVDGVLRGTITVGSKGKGEIEFESSPRPPAVLLDFDPRNKTIDILQSGNLFFTGGMAAQIPGVNDCTVSESLVSLTSTGADADATGSARFRVRDNCERDFRVEVEKLPVGSYDLFVAGALRGSINVVSTNASTKGEIEFDTETDDPGELPLTFDPRNQVIEIKQGATTFFSSTFSGGTNGGACSLVDNEVPLINSGIDADAKGKARFRQDSDCRQNFRVEIENLPADNYTLRVAGVDRGTITVVNVAGDFQGHLEFDTEPDQPGEVLLNFDPRGQLIEGVQGATIFLNRTFPN